jgi:hypothetical protein
MVNKLIKLLINKGVIVKIKNKYYCNCYDGEELTIELNEIIEEMETKI